MPQGGQEISQTQHLCFSLSPNKLLGLIKHEGLKISVRALKANAEPFDVSLSPLGSQKSPTEEDNSTSFMVEAMRDAHAKWCVKMFKKIQKFRKIQEAPCRK